MQASSTSAASLIIIARSVEVTLIIATKQYNVTVPKIVHTPSNLNSVVMICAALAGWKQSGVGRMPSACSFPSRTDVLGSTSLREHGPDGDYDAPTSSRQL